MTIHFSATHPSPPQALGEKAGLKIAEEVKEQEALELSRSKALQKLTQPYTKPSITDESSYDQFVRDLKAKQLKHRALIDLGLAEY